MALVSAFFNRAALPTFNILSETTDYGKQR